MANHLTFFALYLYMCENTTNLFNNLYKLKTLLVMYLIEIDVKNSNGITRPISIEEMNLILKKVIKSSKRIESIELTHLKIVFSILMLILKNCSEIYTIQKSLSSDTTNTYVVFFNDMTYVMNELYSVLETKYINSTHKQCDNNAVV